jgi:Ca2+-binding EF-hand superfamily protein
LSLEEMAPPAERMERMFDRADKDGDGNISAEEFEQIKERGGRRGHGRRGGHGNDGQSRDDG